MIEQAQGESVRHHSGYTNAITWQMIVYMQNDYDLYHWFVGAHSIGKEDILDILSEHFDREEMRREANWEEIFEVVKSIQEIG